METLPYIREDFMFEEILTRLPVKSVVRFKLVSKKWNSSLSSSYFATAHLKKHPFDRPCAPIQTLFIESTSLEGIRAYYLFPFDDNNRISGGFENDLVKLDVDLSDVEGDLNVLGSCNGLICFACMSIDYTYFYLWNPATSELNRYDGLIVSAPDSVQQVACGFGYVSAVDDYKFVRIVWRIEKDGPHRSTIHVFSCRKNYWMQIDYDFDLSAYHIGCRPTLVNERLYWSCSSRSGGIGLIICLDLGAMKSYTFNIPASEAVTETGQLGIMGERLCMVSRRETICRLNILMLPRILNSITLPNDLQGYDPYVYEILGLTRGGKLLVSGEFNPTSSALYLVNTHTEPSECSELMELEGYISMFKYVPSLISPFSFSNSRALVQMLILYAIINLLLAS